MVLDKCMFGRQIEMERVVAFLLQAEEECGDNDGTHQKLGILPIVGPRKAGKTTLVEHACNDERVREHFSQIVSLTLGDLRDEETIASSLRSGRVIRNQQRHASSDDDDHEGSKESHTRTPCVSKIIVTRHSDKIIASLGTTEPLRLDYLTQEAYWYFFKVRTFGSIDASEHPEMVSIALDMVAETNRCLAVVDAFGGLLRSNFNARFWRLTLAVLREIIKKQQLFMNMNDARHRGPTAEVPKQEFAPKIYEKLVYHEDYQIVSVQGEVPKISLQDIIFGGARPKGRFDVLGWTSSIPPYHTYAFSCEIQRRP
ncbi:disease resistance protein RGA2-like [Miscanthus floridulus]|uniref:disease resistance protein RGA2-like n=1 Tax=Miscanthus floridulus TaxID=154761 RepID=UPI00345A0F97